MVAAWDDEGEIDLLEWFAELTMYTSSACLIGKRFRDQLDGRFATLFHDLEQGTDAIAYVDPYADIESFHRRDAARAELVSLIQGIMEGRAAAPAAPEDERDLVDVLMSVKNPDGTDRFLPDEVTGMFISMMFAGHHTTSGTAAWTLIELLTPPRRAGPGRRRAGRAVRRRCRGQLPGPAGHAPPRVVGQGGAPPPPAAHPPAPGGQGGARGRRRRHPRRPDGGGQPVGLQPAARGLPRSGRLPPRPLPRAPRGGPAQSVDLDPVRRRPPPLRGPGLRHDAAEGHLQRAAPRLGVRARPSRRTPTATTTRRWWCSCSSPAWCATADGPWPAATRGR